MNRWNIWAVSFLAVLLIGGLYFYFFDSKVSDLPIGAIREIYPTKKVYRLIPEIGIDELKEDCRIFGGVFNSCGNDCAPGANACDLACSLTCEKIQE